MKLVGVSLREDVQNKHQEIRDCLDTRWYAFFEKTGIVPILIPNKLDLSRELLESHKFDGFLLTGGGDSHRREETEKTILEYALKREIPLIGVCHGMQFIQRKFGQALEEIMGHVLEQQEIVVNNQKRTVNSYHTMGTYVVPQDFDAWAYHEPDCVVKAIRHRQHKLLGVMWHPERQQPFDIEDIKLFTHFFN